MPAKYLRLPVDVLRKEDSSEYCLFCLPSGGRDLLLSVAERFTWDIYVNGDGTKAQLSDSEAALVDDTIRGLIMGCDFESIATALDNIATALGNLQMTTTVNNTCAPDVNVTCGDGGSFIVYPGPGQPPIINPGPLPDTPVNPSDPLPWPTDWPSTPLDPEVDAPPFDYTDWGSYDVAACEAANGVVELAYQMIRAIKDFFQEDLILLAWLIVAINAVISSGIALLFSTAFVIKLAEIAYKLAANLEVEVTIQFLQDIEDWISENRQDLVCDLYEARAGGNSGVNTMLARVLDFAAGLEYAQAEFSTIQELITMIFPPGLFFAALAGGADFENTNAVPCDNCGEEFTPPGVGYAFVPVPYELLTWVKDAHVTVEEGSVFGVAHLHKPTLHYGGATETIQFSALRAYYSLPTEARVIAVMTNLYDASHYVEPYRASIGGVNMVPGYTRLKSYDSWRAEVQALDGGQFVAQFNVQVYGGGDFAASLSTQGYMLNGMNAAFDGTLDMRVFVLFRL